MDKTREEKKNMLKYKKMEEDAKRNHYLISTKQIPGVYNSPYKPYDESSFFVILIIIYSFYVIFYAYKVIRPKWSI